jgi:hypothetical protein
VLSGLVSESSSVACMLSCQSQANVLADVTICVSLGLAGAMTE